MIAKTVLKRVSTTILLLLLGALVGGLATLRWMGAHAGPGEVMEPVTSLVHTAHEDEDHVHLSREAFLNLELQIGTVEIRDYTERRPLPGRVVEIPGVSALAIAAPVGGIVQTIHVQQGQALVPNEIVFALRVTDDQVSNAQSLLLAALSKEDILENELARIGPLSESGTISGRRKRDLEYERQQIVAEINAGVQELLVLGLPEDVVQSIVDSRRLAQYLPVLFRLSPASDGAPMASAMVQSELSPRPSPIRPASHAEGAISDVTVERVLVKPGQQVVRGETLAQLAMHRQLHIEGQAFETDLEPLQAIQENGWMLTAEFGHDQEEHEKRLESRGNLQILYLDNHVDAESQTFRFYALLPNEVASETRDPSGHLFRTWRFKPGQRVHIWAPVRQWEQALVLPLTALAQDGLDMFVFREHLPEHDGIPTAEPADASEAGEPLFFEFEPVPVHVLHRDGRSAVLASDGDLRAGDRIAMNRAYQLQMAAKMHAGGGAGHDHHHH